MLMQKQEQFGNPFYSYYGDVMFAGNYEKLLAENTKYNYPTASDYIQEFGIQSFIDNIQNNKKELDSLIKTLYKYYIPPLNKIVAPLNRWKN